MKQAAKKYRKGLTSLAESPSLAYVSLYEMIEYCQKENITPPTPSDAELEQEATLAKEKFSHLE